MPLVPVLSDMEAEGITVNPKTLYELSVRWQRTSPPPRRRSRTWLAHVSTFPS